MASEGRVRREKRWRGSGLESRRPSRSVLVALLLASATLLALDNVSSSPLDPARRAVGEVFGPAQDLTAEVVDPFAAIPRWFHSKSSLEDRIAELESDNSRLRAAEATMRLDRNRLAEYDLLSKSSYATGYDLVPAHVIAQGQAQSFSNTVTIDAGTSSGVHADMAVVTGDGLVGRVVRATSHTATVLLILDVDSVVGGRLGSNLELGFLRGRGDVGDDGTLELNLTDASIVANEGDTVVTFGSKGGAPYVEGIPVGTVTALFASPRETARRAEIRPFVDFSSLDLVGVLVPDGTTTDRELLDAGGAR